MSRRAHVSWKTKYACALLKLGDVEYEHAKLMHEDQIISLYAVDHNRLHALADDEQDAVPKDHFSNLAPMLRGPHKEKSRKDTGIVAKVKRIVEKNRPACDPVIANILDEVRGAYDEVMSFRRAPQRKIQSRGFQKDTRPKGHRGFQRRRSR